MNKGFQYFGEKLYTSRTGFASKGGNLAVRMTNIPAKTFFGMSRPQEIFYSTGNGNWTDASTWETVSGRTGKIPSTTGLDDVYIRHNVVVTSQTININNLFISSNGVASGTSAVITVNGNIKCEGDIQTIGTLILFGYDNAINKNKITGTLPIITYAGIDGSRPQYIMDLTYARINIDSAAVGPKVLTANTTCSFFQNSNTSGWLELGSFDFTCTGTFNNFGATVKRGAGNTLFVGVANFSGGFYFSQAVNVEFRGGLTVGGLSVARTNALALTPIYATTSSYTNTGTWNFTTNNQDITLSINVTHQFECNILVASGITVNNIFVNSSTVLQVNNTLDNADGTASFVNKGVLYWNNPAFYNVTVGTFDKDSFNTNIVGYVFDGSISLPYSTYQGLQVSGTGTKTAIASYSLTTFGVSTGTFELTTFNLTTSSTGVIPSPAILSKTGAGAISFGGLCTGSGFSFTGNPTVEFKNGWSMTGSTCDPGTAGITFTTNNQTWVGTTTSTLTCDILISGAITVTNAITSTSVLTGILNGNNAASTFDNRTTTGFSYQNATQPMVTGILTTNAAANTFKYNKAGNQDVKGNAYSTVEFGGSGNKTLQGNCTDTSRSTTGTAVLVLNGFTITP